MTALPFSFKMGADPEVFVKGPDGRNVSAHTFCPGTKDHPHDLGDGISVQLDGTAMEFNIAPQPSSGRFSNKIEIALKKLEALLPPGHTLDFSPSVIYDPDIWESIPDSAKVLGCNPDWDAYDVKTNPPPDGNVIPRMRTAAGHIHLGWIDSTLYTIDPLDPVHLRTCALLVQELDFALLKHEPLWDTDTRRRNLYGKPGAFRPKPYGMEYRVLSNAWLNYPYLPGYLFQIIYNAVTNGRFGAFYYKYFAPSQAHLVTRRR